MRRDFFPSIYEILAIVLLYAANTPVDNADGIWHTALGREIKDPRKVPSYTQWYFEPPPKYKDRDYQWLSEMFLFRLYKKGGWRLVKTIKVLTILIIMIVLIGIIQREELNALKGAVLLIITMATTGIMWSIRPTMFSNLFFSILVLLLFSGKKKLFLLIPLIFIIWVNLHPAVFIGLYALFVYALGDLITKKEVDLMVWGIIPVSILAMCVNPYGIRIFELPFAFFQDREMLGQIIEWLPYMNLYFIGFLLFFVFVAIISSPPKFNLVLWITAFFLLPLISTRHQPLFGIASLPFLARQIKGIKMPYPINQWVESFKRYDAGFRYPIWLISAFVFLSIWNAYHPDDAFKNRDYPVEAVNVLKTSEAKRIYVAPLWTGYVILHKGKEQRIFFDWKEPYRTDLFYAVDILETGGPGWKGVVKAYRIDGFLLPKSHPMVKVLRREKGWQCMSEEDGMVFVKLN